MVSDSLPPHGLQHTRLLSLPRVCSDSCPLSQWCHTTISYSATPISSCPQYFSASGSFVMSQLLESGVQNIGALASVLPMNIKDWFPLGLKVCSPCYPRDSQESSPAPQFESIIFQGSAFFMVQHSHPHMTIGKTIPLTISTFVSKVTSLLFNTLSSFVIALWTIRDKVKEFFSPIHKHYFIATISSHYLQS